MERLAHLSVRELSNAYFYYYRDAISDFLSLMAVALGGVVLSLASYCLLF